jgi:2-C-methyl-D-erythritol 2,4-cyclodiphosphate synthase
MFRIGQGYDVHQLVPGRRLVLGGVVIPHEKGLLGHSDADVLLHSIADALLGALALGDIGKFFPPTDIKFKDMDSQDLLKQVYAKVRQKGYAVVNCDATLLAEKPKMAPHIPQMQKNIAACLECDPEDIGLKATTGEKMGFVGREEGLAAMAVVLIRQI